MFRHKVIFEFVYGLMFVGTWYDNYRDQAECHWARRCYKVRTGITHVCFLHSSNRKLQSWNSVS